MIFSHQISDRKTVTHSFNYLFTCHREKPVFEEEMQIIVLKKTMKIVISLHPSFTQDVEISKSLKDQFISIQYSWKSAVISKPRKNRLDLILTKFSPF